MAILHALGMFVLDSDVSAIHEPYHNSWIYMMFFAIAHTLAALASTLFVIKHLGYHISAAIKMMCSSGWFGRKKGETYVFWGLNEPTFHLIENIKEPSSKAKDYRIIVVRSNKNSDDSAEGRSGFNRIFGFLALRNAELEKLQEFHCLSASTNADSTKINPDQKSPKDIDIIGRELNLWSVRRILAKKTCSKIHMLFLSDNESENLHDVALLLGDETINKFVSDDPSREVKFYCHARYNSVHRVIEDLNSKENIKVKVIDSSHLNVEMLKSNKEILPVNFVDVDKDATVSSPFNALVIGFSEVGLDSARFLYEFGAFVKSSKLEDGKPHVVERSDFHLDVTDKKMSDLAGSFVANAPAIKPSIPFLTGKANDDALITLHNMDCCSVEFYHKLQDEWIKTLNYIVIATEDDELNISLGVRIFKMAMRYRNNLDNFCILVRAHNDDDNHIQKIAEHYNRLWAAQKAAAEHPIYKREHNQTSFPRERKAILPIYLFGRDKDVYTYENIIDDALEKDAIKFKEKYEESIDPEYKHKENDDEKQWNVDFKTLMQLCTVKDKSDANKTIDLRPYYPTYSGLMKLRRTQAQDFANSLHKTTKSLLAQKALCLLPYNYDLEVFKRFSRKKDEITYSSSTIRENEISDLTKILDVLAQTEHLRWNASHEIFGYQHIDKTYGECSAGNTAPDNGLCNKEECCLYEKCCYNLGFKDEVRMLHNCLRNWQDLNTYTKSYDYNTVDLTLGIISPDNPLLPSKDDAKSATTPQQTPPVNTD